MSRPRRAASSSTAAKPPSSGRARDTGGGGSGNGHVDDGPAISEAEWLVMDLLWRSQPRRLGSGQIADALAAPHGWSPRTVKTLLARLVKKGAVSAEPGEPGGHPGYLYRAAITRRQAAGREGQSFLQRVFGGAVTPAVAQLLDGARLTPQEAQRLREIIDQAERTPQPPRPASRQRGQPSRQSSRREGE